MLKPYSSFTASAVRILNCVHTYGTAIRRVLLCQLAVWSDWWCCCHFAAAVTGTALATSLGINGAVCVVAFLIFSILRVRPFTRKFFAPKRYDDGWWLQQQQL